MHSLIVWSSWIHKGQRGWIKVIGVGVEVEVIVTIFVRPLIESDDWMVPRVLKYEKTTKISILIL